MAATITGSGTWSALQTGASSQAPGAQVAETIRTHRDTVEQRFVASGLDPKTLVEGVYDGGIEVAQFVGLMAAAYSISSRAAYVRLIAIAQAALQGERPESTRVYVA